MTHTSVRRAGTDTTWRNGITEMTPDHEGPPQVGTNVREVLQLAGRSYITETTVTEVGPGMTTHSTAEGPAERSAGDAP